MKTFTKFFLGCVAITSILGQNSFANWWDDDSLAPAKKFAAANPEEIKLVVQRMMKTLAKSTSETKSKSKSEETLETSLKHLADAWSEKGEWRGCREQEGWIESHLV